MSNCAPILFLIFNRPGVTEKVFSRIKEAQPSKLFIAADGPRPHKEGEADICKKTREIVTSQIDWDCDIQLLFRDVNLGCKVSVSSAISWFFEHVEYGIILEDDCLPEPTFFRFCTELLEKYKHEYKIFSIGGTNVFGEWNDISDSYVFSHQGSIWGWASWRRAWSLYDIELKDWDKQESKHSVKEASLTDQFYQKREELFTLSKSQHVDTWDYQWLYTRLIHKGLSIIPTKNQISNLGFNEEATHTKGKNKKLSELRTYPVSFPLVHPDKIRLSENFEFDFLTFLYGDKNNSKKQESLFKKIKKSIKKFIS